jgi:hypothetical protein
VRVNWYPLGQHPTVRQQGGSRCIHLRSLPQVVRYTGGGRVWCLLFDAADLWLVLSGFVAAAGPSGWLPSSLRNSSRTYVGVECRDPFIGVQTAQVQLLPVFYSLLERSPINILDKRRSTMSADPDSCLPTPVKNFVFDLHDTSFRSQILSEQAALYNGTFRDLSSKVCFHVCVE